MARVRVSVDNAMGEVSSTARYFRQIASQLDKYGIRITVVELFPKPIIDIEIKESDEPSDSTS